MMLIIEKPKADEDRTTRTPGRPCRLTVSGYVIWSSTSCGDRPIQSVKTITWLSDRSGIASIGVVSSAQKPHAATRRKKAITRNRFLSDISISQLIIARASSLASWLETQLIVARSTEALFGSPLEPPFNQLEQRLRSSLRQNGGRHLKCELGA